jgi:predicted DNA-binding protein (MmcQ/YjbR family)
MAYDWLDEYLLQKTAAKKDYKVEWKAVRYLLGGKMFCMLGGDRDGRAIITLKCEPVFGEALRQQYPDIIPGYYMNKQHWNSVYRDGNVPDDVLRHMADMSYDLIRKSLPKKTQMELELL